MHEVRLLFAHAPEIAQTLARMLVSQQHCELLYLLNMLNCLHDGGSNNSASEAKTTQLTPSQHSYRLDSVLSALEDEKEAEVLRRFIQNRLDKVFLHADWQVCGF